MKRKGQIWISAVLYMALGVIVLTIILAAGVPMIQKMKDKNVFAQTKSLFFTLDQNIKDVSTEGPGSKRYLSPFDVKAGSLDVDSEKDWVTWQLRTKAKLMEPSYDFKENPTGVPEFREGSLFMYAQDTNIVDEYFLNLKLDYTGTADIHLQSQFEGPYTGSYSVAIRHNGTYNPDTQLPIVIVEFTV